MTRILLFALLAPAATAFAQERETQRALIQRDQQSAEFALQLRQSQEGILAPGDNRHLNERHRLDNLHALQLQLMARGMPQELLPYERQRLADERLLQFGPPVVRVKQQREKPRRLPAAMPEAVSPIEPAY